MTNGKRPLYPGNRQVHDAPRRHPEFREMYARARALQAMRWREKVLSIADDGTLDPHGRRIRVDTRKWLLSKVLPRIYGDKVTLAGDPVAPIVHTLGVIDLKRLSSAELDALERFADARLVAIDVEDRGNLCIASADLKPRH